MTDKNELSTQAKPALPAEVNQGLKSAGDMMSMLAEMTRDPSVSPEKIIALGEFQLKLYDRAREEEFNKDLNNAIDDMPTITKDGKIKAKGGGTRATYSTFERLMQVVKPVLKAHRLRIRFDVKSQGGVPEIASILTHDNGHEQMSGHLPIPISRPNNSVTNSEASAMSVTRGKRHVLKSTLGIIEQDDDGTGRLYLMLDKEDWQDDLVQQSMQEAMQGLASYEAWFKSIPAMRRGFLVDVGQQAKNKAAAQKVDNPQQNYGDQ